MAFDWQSLLQLAPLALAKPGSPQAAALMQGYLQSQQRIEQEQRQRRLDAQQAQFRQAQIGNLASEGQFRQAQMRNIDADNALARLNTFYSVAPKLAGQAEASAQNPVTANLGLAKELTGLATGLGVEPSQGMAFVPNMAEAVSLKDKKLAQTAVDRLTKDPLYAGYLSTPEGTAQFMNMTVPFKDQQRKVSDLLKLSGGAMSQSATGQLAPTLPKPATLLATHANYVLNGRPIVAVVQNGRAIYRGEDVTDQVTPYVAPSAAPDTRLDRSYNESTKRIDAMKKPVTDTAARLSKLSDTLAQNTPQADALVAPELLTVMAGGLGSGLRMNEAEIARIVGGRSAWENLRAAAQHWQTDPASATTITPAQREQIRSLMETVRTKVTAKLMAIDQAGQALVDAQTVKGHRDSVTALERRLSAIDSAQSTIVPAVRRRPIPGIPGGEAELQDGKWIRVQ